MCTKKPKFAWSLELHQASLILRFWRIKLKELKNKIDARSKLYELQEEIKDDILLGISGELSTKSIHFHIKRAKRLYDTIQRDAIERRQKQLQ